MCDNGREEEFRKLGSDRSSNSLAWAGFALTNFVTVVAIFSIFNAETSIPFQISSSLFLMSGAFFAVSWALNESAGHAYEPRLSVLARPYKIWKQINRNNEELVSNPRETYVRQAQYCNMAGTLVWSIGITILLWYLRMYLAAGIWTATFIVAYLFAIPRYFAWKEKP